MNIPILTASVFAPFHDVGFGFSTRKGGISPEPLGMNMSFNVGDNRDNVIENQRRFLSLMGVQPEQLAIPKQVHGNKVTAVAYPGLYEKCDALITGTPEVFLRVTVADCLPIFLYDPTSRAIGAVHSGWRGCVRRILEHAVVGMKEKFSADLSTLRAYVGPSARSCCYEVGEEVAAQFEGRFLVVGEHHRPRLDMQAFTVALLTALGVEQSQIEVSPQCTICTSDLFHSFRRDRARSGRMMGVIGIRRY